VNLAEFSAQGTVRESDCVQMFPVEHGENFISPLAVTGHIKKLVPALQEVVDNGQQEVVELHPFVHYEFILSIPCSLLRQE
jgi:hypothetical protein